MPSHSVVPLLLTACAALATAALPALADDDLDTVPIGLSDGTPLPDSLLRDGIGPEQLRSVAIPPAIARLIDALDAESFRERELATYALQEQKLDVIVLYRALILDQPTPEQRLRLLMLLHDRVHRPRGALGINMQLRPDVPGIEITRLEPGLPAQKVLLVGDIITHIDGAALGDSNDLIQLVQTKEPGDIIKLIVRRLQRDPEGLEILRDLNGQPQYETLEIDFELGDARRLNNDIRRISPVTRERMNEIAFAESNYSPSVRIVRVRYRDPGSNAPSP